MNLFKRSKSIISKSSSKQQDQPPPTPSSSRQPLIPQTNIALHTPQSSLLPRDDRPTSSDPTFLDSSHPKRLIGRKINHRDVEEVAKPKPVHSSAARSSETRGLAPPPPRISPRAVKPNHSELYSQNNLHNFSFGAAPSASSSSLNPVDPLSRPRDEADSDELSLLHDTTPRPSVVGTQHLRSHQSQPTVLEDWPPSFSPSRKHLGRAVMTSDKSRDSDTTSCHTFGNSSASASVSSLSRSGDVNSRANSRVSGRSSTQTSSNDTTSDDDEGMIGRHPLPPEPRDPRLDNRFMRQQGSSLYISDDESEVGEESEQDVEIKSVAQQSSDQGTYYDYPNQSRDSLTADRGERRGSLAMPILNTPSGRSHLEHRPTDYTTGRRPSRSLEDLHSFTFGQGPRLTSNRVDDPLPPAPTSVPESEGDWRDLRKRSIQRDKDLPPIMPLSNASMTAVASSSSSNANNSAMDEFDWMQGYGVNGVVGFDLSEMTDIVGQGNLGHRPSIYSSRKGSTASALRRQSTVSSNIDIMHKNIMGPWANQKYLTQRPMWTFTREKDRSDEHGTRSSSPGHDKDPGRPSISTLFASRPSTSTDNHPNSITAGIPSFFDKSENKDRSKVVAGKSKEKPHKEPWNGMALDSEEIWHNGMNGKFRVVRKNAISVEPGKSHQQRLNVTYLRSPFITNATNRDPADGPAVTIHKHSKAAAFSISRHFRPKPIPHSSATSPHETSVSLRQNSFGQLSSKDSAEGARKKGNMILLGTRRVQRAYTSTNTTRKLESHGLLDESGRTSPRDAERMKRESDRERQRPKDKGKEREREKDKEKKKVTEAPSSSKRPTDKQESKSKDNSQAAQKALLDSSGGSSAGSVANALFSDECLVNTTLTTPELTESPSSVGSVVSVDSSIQGPASSDRTISVYRNQTSRRGHDDVDEDDVDSLEDRPKYPTRTPHSETYAALPPEVFESAHQEHPHTNIFSQWVRSKGADRNGHRPNQYLDASYKPAWPVTQPRSNSETRKGIVEDLNMSFQDVGLLPAIGEIKGSSGQNGQHKRRRDQHPKKHSKRSDKTDIFEEVPEDALYMLLPLWPGETDPNSAKKYPFTLPNISTNTRQYLLIYWIADPSRNPEPVTKSKGAEKKRGQEGPISSPGDSGNERVILLQAFHISARVFAYRDLQGSGVRIPDIGLAVSGPLEDAFNSIPTSIHHDDFVIGFCSSRSSGIEFVPEGFEKMGLSRGVPNPGPMDRPEDDDSQSFDTVSVLTPIGRAVMEMAWLGSMALTSFNPNLA